MGRGRPGPSHEGSPPHRESDVESLTYSTGSSGNRTVTGDREWGTVSAELLSFSGPFVPGVRIPSSRTSRPGTPGSSWQARDPDVGVEVDSSLYQRYEQE